MPYEDYNPAQYSYSLCLLADISMHSHTSMDSKTISPPLGPLFTTVLLLRTTGIGAESPLKMDTKLLPAPTGPLFSCRRQSDV